MELDLLDEELVETHGRDIQYCADQKEMYKLDDLDRDGNLVSVRLCSCSDEQPDNGLNQELDQADATEHEKDTSGECKTKDRDQYKISCSR